jgi:hypothetical protein
MYLAVVIIIIAIILITMTLIHWTSEGYYGSGGSPLYATLGSYGYSSPLFEPDVLRRCASGSYMYTSNPDLMTFCSTVPPAVLDRVACQSAYRGRPLHLEYTAPAYGTACDKMTCGRAEPSLTLS